MLVIIAHLDQSPSLERRLTFALSQEKVNLKRNSFLLTAYKFKYKNIEIKIYFSIKENTPYFLSLIGKRFITTIIKRRYKAKRTLT